MTLVVCPLRYLDQVVAERRPSHLITLLAPHEMIGRHPDLAPERHLRIGVDDIAFPQDGLVVPDGTAVERILDFGAGWDAAAPMVVHCFAGISRSTATAFVLACARDPAADEAAIAQAMRRASPHAFPNRRIVALADDILGRGGRMLEAVEAMGGNNFVPEGAPFDLPVGR
ncbi:MAG TPA: hypothetical protein VG939_07370 [Caulobacteraceae bacterium]|nr:hypothetical protein [Caulobacteraceae bacterium]